MNRSLQDLHIGHTIWYMTHNEKKLLAVKVRIVGLFPGFSLAPTDDDDDLQQPCGMSTRVN